MKDASKSLNRVFNPAIRARTAGNLATEAMRSDMGKGPARHLPREVAEVAADGIGDAGGGFSMIRYITIHIDKPKLPKNVESDSVHRIVRAPYGSNYGGKGFGKVGEWVPLTKSGGIATHAFRSHSFPSKLLDRWAAKFPSDVVVTFEVWP